jgi:nucleoside-diphosphate-sugar epimerase
MRVLVTGGAGFIGSHLVERLVKDGHDVLALDNLSTGSLGNIREFLDVTSPLHFWAGDVRRYGTCLTVTQGVEVVFHLAALGSVPRSIEDPHTTNEVNVAGTLNLLDTAREAGVRRFVNVSSSSVYGLVADVNGMKCEDSRLVPLSPYGVSKLAAEHYCDVFAQLKMLDTISLRPFNVFGPRQNPDGPYAAVIPRFIKACSAGEPLVVFGSGQQTRDFTYVSNVVDALVLAAGSGFNGALNVGCGQATSVARLASMIAAGCGKEEHVEHAPERPGDVPSSLASIECTSACLGYEPKADLVGGLTRTIEWFEAQQGRRT